MRWFILVPILLPLLVVTGCMEEPVQIVFADVDSPQLREFVSGDELWEFLRQDKTNENEYVEGVYDCNEFAHDLMLAARAKGFDVWVYPHKWKQKENGKWHAACCTRIGGWYWIIYPQADKAERLVKWHG